MNKISVFYDDGKNGLVFYHRMMIDLVFYHKMKNDLVFYFHERKNSSTLTHPSISILIYTTQPNSYLSRRIHIFIYFQSAPTRAHIYHKKSPLSPPFPFSLDSIIWKQTVKNQPTTITLSNELQYLDSSIIHDHIIHLKISIFRSLFRLEFNKSITQRVIGKFITNDLMIAPSLYYPYLTTCHSKSFKN